jgi:hypothetical protein
MCFDNVISDYRQLPDKKDALLLSALRELHRLADDQLSHTEEELGDTARVDLSLAYEIELHLGMVPPTLNIHSQQEPQARPPEYGVVTGSGFESFPDPRKRGGGLYMCPWETDSDFEGRHRDPNCSDRDPSARGADADKVLECDAYTPNVPAQGTAIPGESEGSPHTAPGSDVSV